MSATPQNEPPSSQTPKNSRRTTILVVLAAIAVVVLPLILTQGRSEISRWHQADAQEKALDDDLDGAVESMDAALQWDDSATVYLMRAGLKLKNGDYEGCVDDCETAIELTQSGPVAVAMAAHGLRSQAYLELGEHEKSIDDQKTIGELLKKDSRLKKRSTYLNDLAYFRALGNIELDEAAKDATKAVELLGDEDQLTPAILRASLACQWEAASPVLQEVVQYLQRQLSRESRQVKQEITDEIAESFPPSNRSAAQMNRLAEEHLKVSEQLWLLERRQSTPDAIAMTDEENESSSDDALQTALNSLPSMQRSQQILSNFAPLLDTKGFVFYKLALTDETEERAEQLAKARRDLDRAVVAMEVLVQAERTLMVWHQHRIADPRSAKASMKQAEQSLAVLRYHRGLVLKELGEPQLAARDFTRVKQLGHEPNEQLH